MKILSITTSSSNCSVALLDDLNLVKEFSINNTKTHSENLLPLINQLFNDTNTSLSDVKLIICDKGPGSFTGIRIGISTVKAFSYANNVDIIGVSSLDGLAYNVFNCTSIICSLIDARNNQIYAGVFDSNYNLIKDYIADDINNIANFLKSYGHIVFVGDGSLIHSNILKQYFQNCTFCKNNTLNAFSVGKCGFNKFKNGEVQNADTIMPMYLRPSQAERLN